MTQLLKTAALTVDYSGERRELEARGALAVMVQPALKKINQRLSEEKPALIREKDLVASTWLPPIPSGPFRRLLLAEAKIAIGRPVPQTVSIEVTRECGCNCAHCTVKEGEGELSKEDIFRVIDEALELGACIITFTEGDPLMREDIYDFIRHVDPEKAVVQLFTPGLELTPENAEKLKDAGVYNVIIGLYSSDPAVHDGVRGVIGAHSMAVEAIRNALSAGLLVTAAAHIVSSNVDTIPELYEFAKSLGVHELSLWEGIPRTSEDRLTQIDREKILNFYRRVNSTPGGPRVFASTYFEGQMMGCMAGRRWVHVGVDGSVRGCSYLQKPYGNVTESSLKEVWRGMKSSKDFDSNICNCPAQDLFALAPTCQDGSSPERSTSEGSTHEESAPERPAFEASSPETAGEITVAMSPSPETPSQDIPSQETSSTDSPSQDGPDPRDAQETEAPHQEVSSGEDPLEERQQSEPSDEVIESPKIPVPEEEAGGMPIEGPPGISIDEGIPAEDDPLAQDEPPQDGKDTPAAQEGKPE